MGQRRRRCANIETALGECPVFAGLPLRVNIVSCVGQPRKRDTRHIEPMLFSCWPNVCDVSPILKLNWFNVSCLLGTSQTLAHNVSSTRLCTKLANPHRLATPPSQVDGDKGREMRVQTSGI